MITKKLFLLKYNISEENYSTTGFLWKDLEEIHDNYKEYQSELEASADYFVKILHKVKHVHSIRYRLKAPEHLIEKIIRKKLENPERNITKENYREQITDLIGIRLIHLYKENWEPIHEFLIKKWDLHEEPIAYYREGDVFNEEYYQKYQCVPKKHKAGYRSVHYLIKHTASKTDIHIAELQVRTLFEEGWCEIDHNTRYPYNLDNPLINQYLRVFNGLSQTADEMGSFIIVLQKGIDDLLKKIENIEAETLSNPQESKDVKKPIRTNSTSNKSYLERIAALNQQISNMDTLAKIGMPTFPTSPLAEALGRLSAQHQIMMAPLVALAILGKLNSEKWKL